MYYVFPFQRVRPGSRIVLYGNGVMGADYAAQLKATGYGTLIGIADRTVRCSGEQWGVPLIPPESIPEVAFDSVVIASKKYAGEIRRSLMDLGVAEGKIVWMADPIRLHDAGYRATPATYDWDGYYTRAERGAESQFARYIEPFLTRHPPLPIRLDRVLDFACGRGRIAALMAPRCGSLVCADIGEASVAFCRQRFREAPQVSVVRNDAAHIPLPDADTTFIYSWDAMVHFRYKDLDRTLSEFARLLVEGGIALIHHSNLAETGPEIEKRENWQENPHIRSNVGRQDVAFIASHHGLAVLEQHVIDWGTMPELDAISVVQRMR